jgi:tetratricopeptide (TPR) repeat protein
MATYKKRGYKPKTKAEKEVAIEDGSATAEVFSSLDAGASRTEAWVEKNQKYILGIVIAAAVIVLGYLAYNQFIMKPKQEEAMNEMYQATYYYEQALTATDGDSLYNWALNGQGNHYGFIEIADKYSGTDAANLANYYAGVSYLNTNRYSEAINFLDAFKSDDANVAPVAKGAIGDAFVQLGQNDEALKYYEEAAGMVANEFITPRFLLKAGLTAMNLGQASKAAQHFQGIIDNYPKAAEAKQAKAYIGKAESMQ